MMVSNSLFSGDMLVSGRVTSFKLSLIKLAGENLFVFFSNEYPPGNDHLSPLKVAGKMIFLFHRWDMLVHWRV